MNCGFERRTDVKQAPGVDISAITGAMVDLVTEGGIQGGFVIRVELEIPCEFTIDGKAYPQYSAQYDIPPNVNPHSGVQG